MKKQLGTLILSLAVAMGAMALPAKPGPVIVTEADGTERTVYLHGDEFFHYMTAEDGRWLEMHEGFLRETESMTEEQIVLRREQAREARIPRRVMEAMQASVPLNIAPRGLIILAQYSDVDFSPSNTLAAFQAMFDSENYSYNGATGSARRYFEDQSFGAYRPIFDIVGPITVSHNQRYYGENSRSGDDSHPDELIIEACQIADTAFNVDFSIYDNDHDGFIDFVYVIYAGRGEADGGPSYTIWPHTSWIYEGYGKTVRLDGKLLNTYACSSELQYAIGGTKRDGIGAFCHEFSHVLGHADHYATNNNSAKQTGAWDLMCSGSYNNNSNTPAGYTAFERFFMGWTTPVILNEPVTIDSMQPLVTSGECYLISETGEHNLIGNDPKPTTFYLLENRYRSSWDGYVPGNGLLITRVKFSYQKWVNNTVNNTASNRCYEIIEADGKEPTYGSEGWDGKQGDVYPTGKVDSYSPYENYPITNIKRTENGIVSFDFMGGDDFPSKVVKETAVELYGDEYTEIVAVYTVTGIKVQGEGKLNELLPGFYIVAVSNGKKQKGVKIYIR